MYFTTQLSEDKFYCWKTNFCECPEAKKLCKKNMINTFYDIYKINEEEDRQKILKIFQ